VGILDALLSRVRLPAPKAPPYSADEWEAAPWPERIRMACLAWALDGYGSPLAIYALYGVKVLFYVAAWVGFCSLNGSGGDGWSVLLEGDAFKKAILWSMVFEVLGLGCGSGPLTGRYMPPVAAPLHFLRPGTIKLPLIQRLPLLGGHRRTWLDAGLYLALLLAALRALMAPAVTPELVGPCVVLLVVLGLSDKTIFLAARAEHYGALLVCFLFADDWIAGAMVVQIAIWMWAAVSKLNRHFPSVVCVMTSNSPVLRWAGIRKAMYRDFPNDLRPSRLALWMAHGGTAVEFTFPLLLVMGDGGMLTVVGLVTMVVFHTYITSNFPMAVPIEWNVMVVFGGLFLFGLHPEVGPLSVGSPVLAVFLIVSAVIVPLVGNLRPSAVSFLMAMRYYAGNWAWSVWLFRGDAADKLDQHIPKAGAHPEKQLARFYGPDTIVGLMSKVAAFRAMHLHGRALSLLLPKAVDDIDAYAYAEGEIIAGMVLGYNFGEGHLHDHRLLAAVQDACGFESGELRHICVEGQPLFKPRLHWQIRDAKDGLLREGDIEVDDLIDRQPWPEAQTATGS